MKLRTRKRLLNLASVSLLVVAVLLVVSALTEPLPNTVLKASPQKKNLPRLSAKAPKKVVVNAKDPSWERRLRRPLYDPPPAPKIAVKKQVRPITVKLTGTILEAENSQAFLRRANGKVELKRVGDLVTDDPLDGLIEKITATSITIRREEEEIQLTVESPN